MSGSDVVVAAKPLLTKVAFCALLGGMSERKFDELMAAGLIPQPFQLSPKLARWKHQDFEDVAARLQRRVATPEPQSLAAGRRARIDRIKTGGGLPAAAQG